MGTPQVRCREMHHSLRPEVKAVMRFFPPLGTHSTPSIASSASPLKASTLANHWSVARKMVGFFVRQSYGYLCSYDSSRSRAPVAFTLSITAALPSPSTLMPLRSSPASAVNRPASSTGESSSRPYLSPVW